MTEPPRIIWAPVLAGLALAAALLWLGYELGMAYVEDLHNR